MSESPCKQCISFAICKIQINDMETPDVTHFSIARDCETLRKYIGHDPGVRPRIDVTRKLFGIGTLYE